MVLTPKAFDVLRYLVERADRLVTQDEILEALWPEIYVNPEGIRKYILEIRKVLGDSRSTPVFIETFPKRGYQFIADVKDDDADLQPCTTTDAVENVVGRLAELAKIKERLGRAFVG